jgi:hypothetical protein
VPQEAYTLETISATVANELSVFLPSRPLTVMSIVVRSVSEFRLGQYWGLTLPIITLLSCSSESRPLFGLWWYDFTMQALFHLVDSLKMFPELAAMLGKPTSAGEAEAGNAGEQPAKILNALGKSTRSMPMLF